MKILKEIIDKFLLYHTGGHICSDHDQNLLSLPVRLVGFGVPIKPKRDNSAPKPYE